MSLFSTRKEQEDTDPKQTSSLPKAYVELFARLSELRTTTAKDAMTERALVEALDADVEVARLHLDEDLAKYLPVYQGDLDHVLGWMSSEMVHNLFHHAPSDSLRNHYVPAITIVESMPLDQVFLKFVQTSAPLFVVKNDAGSTVGILYLNDVLELFFGLELDAALAMPAFSQSAAR